MSSSSAASSRAKDPGADISDSKCDHQAKRELVLLKPFLPHAREELLRDRKARALAYDRVDAAIGAERRALALVKPTQDLCGRENRKAVKAAAHPTPC